MILNIVYKVFFNGEAASPFLFGLLIGFFYSNCKNFTLSPTHCLMLSSSDVDILCPLPAVYFPQMCGWFYLIFFIIMLRFLIRKALCYGLNVCVISKRTYLNPTSKGGRSRRQNLKEGVELMKFD